MPSTGILADIPNGTQPERDGRLLCRYCGRWCRPAGGTGAPAWT